MVKVKILSTTLRVTRPDEKNANTDIVIESITYYGENSDKVAKTIGQECYPNNKRYLEIYGEI